MNSGLIDKNGNKIECDYYEIEELCIKIIENYCALSNENNQKFIEFAAYYTYFSPYFDFVVGELGYNLINPWLQKNFLLCSTTGRRNYKQKKYDKSLDMYVPYEYGQAKIGYSSDRDLQIKPFNQKSGNYYPSFITENLQEMVPNVNGHRELAKQILNLGMIKDKTLCEEIMKIDFKNTDAAEILMWYWPLLRFDNEDEERKECSIIYRSDNISKEQEELKEKLKKEGKLSWICFDQVTRSRAVARDWSYKFYNKERRIPNENQRL